MLKSYIKIAWRNGMKNKLFSLINVLGLSIGITVCLMIYLFISNELSFDSFHQQGPHIYRVMRSVEKNQAPYLSMPYANALRNDYPAEIKKAVRVAPTHGLVTFADQSFTEKKLYVADPDFFNVFTFPLVRGNASGVLNDPSSVVLTEATAVKYFGGADGAMGKVINLDKRYPLRVTGIAKNLPSNSHLDFDLVVPFSNFENESFATDWMSNNSFLYLLLNDKIQKAQLEARFPQFMQKYLGPVMAGSRTPMALSLTPLKDIYLEQASAFDNVKHGDKAVIYIFLSIAILILLIACINFMNLSTLRAIDRSKEVGLRKVMGALRSNLVWQFIGEAIMLTLISSIIAISLLQLLMPWYQKLLGYSLPPFWRLKSTYVFLSGIVFFTGCMAGIYPAVFLSRFSPIQALKSKLNIGRSGSAFRQALVIIQFSISVLLIIGTIIVVRQMRYVKNKDLGYNKEQAVVVKLDNDDIFNKRQLFKQQLEASSAVRAASLMSGEPGGFFDSHGFEADGQKEPWRARTEFADFEYVKTLGLKIIAGRDFSSSFSTDSAGAVLINRTAAAALRFTPEQAIGKRIRNQLRDSLPRQVVGVVEDFNFLSLKEKTDALIISPADDRRVALIKLNNGALDRSMTVIENIYKKLAPGYPFEYSFLDQQFDAMYKTDIRQQTILGIFSGLAIFIACMGLFGLASFTTARRTKEIGVRKVLGSTASSIVLLLSKDLLKPVLIATIIAVPAGYYLMGRWLQNFAYRTGMQWWIFMMAGIIAVAIAFITISLKAGRAATANPVKSLRSE